MPLLTPIDIANTASALFGGDPIESFDADLGGGQSASLLYEMVVDFNLGLQPSGFQFAREVRQLSRVDNVPAFTGFSYVFDIPGPFIGPPVFLTDDPSDPDRRYRRYILTAGQVQAADNPLYAMVKYRPDPNRWTPSFKAATIHALAASLALATASDKNTFSILATAAYGPASFDYRGGMMRAAINEDGFANPPRPADFSNNPLLAAWKSS